MSLESLCKLCRNIQDNLHIFPPVDWLACSFLLFLCFLYSTHNNDNVFTHLIGNTVHMRTVVLLEYYNNSIGKQWKIYISVPCFVIVSKRKEVWQSELLNCVGIKKFGLRKHQKFTNSEEKCCTRLEKPTFFHLPSLTLFLSFLCYCADLLIFILHRWSSYDIIEMRWSYMRSFLIIFGKQIIRHSFQTNTFPISSIQKPCTISENDYFKYNKYSYFKNKYSLYFSSDLEILDLFEDWFSTFLHKLLTLRGKFYFN